MKRNPMMNNPQDIGASSITKNLTTRSSSWRSYFFFPLVALFLGLLMLSADTSFASHGRGGSITWTPTGNAREVQITSRQGWRADAFGPVPSVGATMSNDYFDFGDASGFYPTYTVTAVNVAENWMEITSVFTHTYTTDGNYTVVSQNSCCRISNLSGGNADAYYKIQTEISINSASQNKAPISSMPIILYVNPGVTTNYVIPATDPDGDPLTYSFASNTETNLVANPGSTSISLSGSTLTVDAAVLGANTLWAVVVKVADNKGAYINLDFIISVSGTASAPPAFDYGVTPANGFVYNVGVGTPINFSLKADDPDVADVVNISVTGSPIGSVFTPTSGNPGTATFSFTPAASGSYVVLFSASDGASSVGTSVIINVGAVSSTPFITKWIPSSGHIKIPTSGGGYNYNIDVIHVLTNTSVESASNVMGGYTTTAVLNPADEYLVKISEAVPGSGFPYFYSLGLNAGERADLKEIVQ
ncbi:MAG TPA: hypothetical protein PKX92_11135, partial [Edaphocola sp.]|nr:hypothetical protein [Edaphocola sp.]